MKTGFYSQWWLWWWFWLLVMILKFSPGQRLLHLPQIQIVCINSTLLFPSRLNFKTRTICHTELRNSARLSLFVKDFWEFYKDLMLTVSPCSPLYRHSYHTQALITDPGPASGGQERFRKHIPHLLAGSLLKRSWRVKLMVCIYGQQLQQVPQSTQE